MTNGIKEIVIRMAGQIIIAMSVCMLNAGIDKESPVTLGVYLFLWIAGWAIYDLHYKFKNL